MVIVGEPGAPRYAGDAGALRRRSLPDLLLTIVGPGETLPEGHPAPGKGIAKAEERRRAHRPAYVCQAMTCSLPITDPAA